MEGHRVDGEVSPGEVLAHVRDKAHLVGVATVGVRALHAVRGGLHRTSVHDRRDRAVGRAGLVNLDARGTQHARRLLPGRRRGDVNVVARTTEQRVAHPAAHDPGLVARGLEGVQHAQGIGGQLARQANLDLGHAHPLPAAGSSRPILAGRTRAEGRRVPSGGRSRANSLGSCTRLPLPRGRVHNCNRYVC